MRAITRPSTRHVVLAALLAAACTALFVTRVFTGFDPVRIKAAQVPAEARAGIVRVVIRDTRVRELIDPFAVIAHIRNESSEPVRVSLALAGATLCDAEIGSAQTQRIDCVAPVVPASWSVEFQVDGPNAPWTLTYLELATHHGRSSSPLTALVLPSGHEKYSKPAYAWAIPVWLVLTIAFALPLAPAPSASRLEVLAGRTVAVLVAALFVVVFVAPLVSPFRVVISPGTFFGWIAAALAMRVLAFVGPEGRRGPTRTLARRVRGSLTWLVARGRTFFRQPSPRFEVEPAESRWPAYVAAGLGFVWFVRIGGLPTLNPTNIQWLLAGDWRQHWLGWMLFREAPWTLPLGSLPNALYPVGSTVAFADGNPLVSVLLKPFSGWLPDDFQFIGAWLLLCFVLQGYFGARLASLVTTRPMLQAIAGGLFVMNPPLLERMGHDTLCAHWVILGQMYLALRPHPDARSRRRSTIQSIGLVVIAAAIHPYLAFMAFGLAVASFVGGWRLGQTTLRRAIAAIAIAGAGMGVTFGLFGYFGVAQLVSEGFGIYSTDLLGFVTSGDKSRWIPSLPQRPGQGEGFSFLGAGGVLASAIAVIVAFRSRALPGPRWRPVIAMCVLMWVFALSSVITAAGQPILDLSGMYAPIRSLVEVFRSSGRFTWPLHYLTLVFGVWGVVQIFHRSRHASLAALIGVVGLQAADLRVYPSWAEPKEAVVIQPDGYRPAIGRYTHLALYPMQVTTACADPIEEDRVHAFMLLAYRLNLTFNSGYYARIPYHEVRAACAAFETGISRGQLNPQTVYIVSPTHLEPFRLAKAVCGRIDGQWLCVARDSDAVFRRYLETGQVTEPGLPR